MVHRYIYLLETVSVAFESSKVFENNLLCLFEGLILLELHFYLSLKSHVLLENLKESYFKKISNPKPFLKYILKICVILFKLTQEKSSRRISHFDFELFMYILFCFVLIFLTIKCLYFLCFFFFFICFE